MSENGNGSMTQALTARQESGVDLAHARNKSEAAAAVEAQVFMAKQFPRNEAQAYARLLKACQRPSFALEATFSFPRGGSKVEGGSISLAREAKRLWGNIDSGNRIVRDDGETIFGEAFAWDFETNTRERREFQVSKYLWKKGRRGEPGRHVLVGAQRGEDDKDLERDLREKFQNIAARAERECVFHLIPRDFIEEAILEAKQTVSKQMREDPEAAKKAIIRGMMRVNVTPEMIEQYVGCKIDQLTPKQIEELRDIYQKLVNGDGTWRDLTQPEPPPDSPTEPRRATIDPSALEPSSDPNRGHGKTAPTSSEPGGPPASEASPSASLSSRPAETTTSQESPTATQTPEERSGPVGGDGGPETAPRDLFTSGLSLRSFQPGDELDDVRSWITTQVGPSEAEHERFLRNWEGTKEDILERAATHAEARGVTK